MFELTNFIADPTQDELFKINRVDLTKIAAHFKVGFRKTITKRELQILLLDSLHELGVFGDEEKMMDYPDSVEGGSEDLALQIKKLELQAKEHDRVLLREREEWEREKERQMNRERHELELKRLEMEQACRLKEMELKSRERGLTDTSDFDVSRNIRMVPQFREQEVDKFFALFERVANNMKWPKTFWPMLLQCVFVGKAQEAFSSLSVEESLDYDQVKVSVLRVYELVPEAYRQKFRNLRKTNETYVEFAREKESMFDRWCVSMKVKTFEELRELIILEEFKNCLPERVVTYLNEQKVLKCSAASALADEYVLTHKNVFSVTPKIPSVNSHRSSQRNLERPLPVDKVAVSSDKSVFSPVCFYCKKRGHIISECNVLKKKNNVPKPVGLLMTSSSQVEGLQSLASDADMWKDEGYVPFMMDGFVSLAGKDDLRKPVKILRDTGAAQSFILEGVLPLSDESFIGSSVLVQGFEMGFVKVPLHEIEIESSLVVGRVVVGVRPCLPVRDVTFILGNDLAGGKVFASPEVTDVPLPGTSIDALAQTYPEVFPSCAVTRAMTQRLKDKNLCESESEWNFDLSDTFLSNADFCQVKCSDFVDGLDIAVNKRDEHSMGLNGLSLSREQLIVEQRKDEKTSSLFEAVVPVEQLEQVSQGYFVEDGVLMRKWRPPTASADDEWQVVKQIIVPSSYRSEILSLAHDSPFAGHLGVNKTYDRILRNFFWPGLKTDVASYCRSCHVCQMTGKPNQNIPPAPLHPIPAFSEPFERVMIDCVGPLPRTKSGNQYLLTIMCSSTRFPEAIPLRKITAPVIVKSLVKFFSLFGLPRTIQSDQGTNFMSRVFKQALEQLHIQHRTSSCYHPESQGALERFHQTLKSMLRAFCLEFQKDWDDGVPMVMFAVREVVQESLGFSPAELVFGHTVRGPLKVIKDHWTSDPTPNILDYVSGFRFKLRRACELAKENLEISQRRMKKRYDRCAKLRSFAPGDKVLVLMPVPGSALQARYYGPYPVKEKVSELDYVISTNDRRKKTRLCHINMLKPYFERPPEWSGRKSAVLTVLPTDFPVTEGPVLSSADVPEDGVLSSAESFIRPECPLSDNVAVATCEGDVEFPAAELVAGRLKNSSIIRTLDSHFSHLTVTERADVISIIRKYENLFSDVPSCTSLIEHDIDVGDSLPIKQHAYRVSPEKRTQLQHEVNFMLENDIAEPSFSPWSSPCLLVKKTDGTFRFCTDFRRVNAVTKPDSYPLPRMEDCVDHVGNAAFVTKIDLLKGYWQVPLSDRAKEISAFVTPDHFLHYKVMAFGLRNAPATFQRLVNRVIKGMHNVEAYLDDLVIYSASWSEHVEQLEELFSRLSRANLTVNLVKCEFGRATVTYLGKIVGSGQVRPVESKVEAITNFPMPTTRRELRRFLGMVGYYRSFCKNFSVVASPLTDLLSPKVAFKWTETCQLSFEKIKALLVSSPVLSAPDFSTPFFLAVDASDTGAGAVLLQLDQAGVEHPVCYFSRKFNKHQRGYSTIEKEALALVLAIQHFDVYIASVTHPLIVYTDHNPLTFISRMKNNNQRLMRWSLFLQTFELDIRHIRGKDNVIADALSRT